MAAREQRDRGRAHRRDRALAAVRAAVARAEPRPGDPAGEALVVEPARLVFGKARRQDLGLPGAGRRLEALELGDHDLERVRPLHARVGRDVLPAEQEAEKIARRDRLDLGPQALDRVAVDAGEQPALAPFVGLRLGREPAAQREALDLERRECGRDRARLEPERRRERLDRERPLALEPAAHDLDQRLVRRPVARQAIRRGDRGIEPGFRPERLELRQALGGDPKGRRRRVQPGHAPVARERFEQVGPARPRLRFFSGQKTEPDQAVVQLVGVRGLGPGFGAHASDRLGIEPAEVGRVLGRQPAPAHHGLGAALLERRVVEIGVRPGREHLERERRGLGQVARDDLDRARLERGQQPLQALDVHRVVQAVGDRLADQRVVGDLALADDVLQAGELVGEDRRDQVLGVHARELRRHLAAAAEARQRERHRRDPAPAGDEHRRIEQRLDQQRPDARRMQVARDLGELEAVRRGQRQDDVVLGRGRLQLEIELAAEALAQRQPPGAVDPAAERRMDHELHAAGFVEEALEHDPLLGRQAAERRVRRRQIFGELARRPARRGRARPISQAWAAPPAGSVFRCPAISVRRRETDAESSSLRPGASPSQNGIVGGWPCASSTRTTPLPTRRMR